MKEEDERIFFVREKREVIVLFFLSDVCVISEWWEREKRERAPKVFSSFSFLYIFFGKRKSVISGE